MSQVNQNFQKARQRIMDEHPNFDQIKDSRITIFNNCIVALDGVYVCFIVRSFELWEDSWWKKMDAQIHGFDSFTVTAYFNLLFIALENGFRSFYKHVCPSKKEPNAFLNVYDDILEQLQLTRYFKLMEILRRIRNAVMHQNGIYHGEDKKFDGIRKLSYSRTGNV
jgi:hypothetical protein